MPSRPTSRFSDRYGATSPAVQAVQAFDGQRASHRLIPGNFRGCNFAAGMNQESLLKPSRYILLQFTFIIPNIQFETE